MLLVAWHLKTYLQIMWSSLWRAVSLRKGPERYQWRLAEVRCLLVENYSNSRQVWSSRSFLQFLGGLRPNKTTLMLLQCSFLPKDTKCRNMLCKHVRCKHAIPTLISKPEPRADGCSFAWPFHLSISALSAAMHQLHTFSAFWLWSSAFRFIWWLLLLCHPVVR